MLKHRVQECADLSSTCCVHSVLIGRSLDVESTVISNSKIFISVHQCRIASNRILQQLKVQQSRLFCRNGGFQVYQYMLPSL